MTEQEFILAVGHHPEKDDLERVNCDKAGQVGHWQCGWCINHAMPHFMCGCLNSTPQKEEK